MRGDRKENGQDILPFLLFIQSICVSLWKNSDTVNWVFGINSALMWLNRNQEGLGRSQFKGQAT